MCTAAAGVCMSWLYLLGLKALIMQVLALAWVLTEGGAIARPLGVEVTKGAANTAALRRYAPRPRSILVLLCMLASPLPVRPEFSVLHNKSHADLCIPQERWPVILACASQCQEGGRRSCSYAQIKSMLTCHALICIPDEPAAAELFHKAGQRPPAQTVSGWGRMVSPLASDPVACTTRSLTKFSPCRASRALT